MDMGVMMKCENCAYGKVVKTQNTNTVKKATCNKFKINIELTKYKDLKCCLFFERGEINAGNKTKE